MRDKIIYGTVRQYHIWFIGFYMDGKHSLTDENRILYNRKHLFYEKGAERLYAPFGRMDSYLTSHAG